MFEKIKQWTITNIHQESTSQIRVLNVKNKNKNSIHSYFILFKMKNEKENSPYIKTFVI